MHLAIALAKRGVSLALLLSADRSQELTAKAILTAQFPDYKFDVKNQASFARWRVALSLNRIHLGNRFYSSPH